jgi:hypothetical protein
MIISDKFRFVFVHIPKCAGTSVRKALISLDDRVGKYQHVKVHDNLGRLDYAHIPLKVLKKYFKEDYLCIENYQAFAIVRDPPSRFPSALAQRLLMYKNRKLNNLTDHEAKREIDEVISYLSCIPKETPVLKPEFIHFARQIDYVEIDGHVPIKTVYTVEEIKYLFAWVERITDQAMRSDDGKNMRLDYNYKTISVLDHTIRGLLQAVLPEQPWITFSSAVKRLLIRSGLLVKEEVHPQLFQSRYVADFISNFYRDDFLLYQKKMTIKKSIGKSLTYESH